MCVDRLTGPGSRGATTLSLMRYSQRLHAKVAQESSHAAAQLFSIAFSLLKFFFFGQIFFYNVNMLPSELFESHISLRVSTRVEFEVIMRCCIRLTCWLCSSSCRCIIPIHWGPTASWENSRYESDIGFVSVSFTWNKHLPLLSHTAGCWLRLRWARWAENRTFVYLHLHLKGLHLVSRCQTSGIFMNEGLTAVLIYHFSPLCHEEVAPVKRLRWFQFWS